MRKQRLINEDWLYIAEKLPIDSPDDKFETITLPHSNKVFPHHNVDNLEYQFISTYRKHLHLELNTGKELVFLDFDGVMIACTVSLNDKLVYEHKGGFTPFSVDITAALKSGDNVLTVFVDSHERKDIPPYGQRVDYLTFGGIYRDVTLRIVSQTYIDSLFVQTNIIKRKPEMSCDVCISGSTSQLTLQVMLIDQDGNIVGSAQANVGGNVNQIKFPQLSDIVLWSLENPYLYKLFVFLYRENELLDSLSTRFGFRTCEFRSDGGFYLNGQRIKLVGLNRHQTYPYIGAAAPQRLQCMDAEIIKFELACNVVRTSHYPQSPHFLNRCDEIGLLVFEEISGWQHIGDKKWQDISLGELEAMIKRDRNHPSIILWGVRINESGDDDEFYTRTNALAHKLDPSRQTGGARFFHGSSFLEDVYTYNDFSNSVLEPSVQPYLISEFAGHMYPTKNWDHEERLIDHALLHAKIQNLQMGNANISGAIGWCAFDYATHIEFGSGDRICYHGVMDIFRLPKWAAYFYKSQQDPSNQIVLQAVTHWTMGDRSGGGNNPLTVFTNCEEVEVIIGENNLGKYLPDSDQYPYLPHPPMTIPIAEKFSAWGQSQFDDLHLVGYVQGKPVCEQWIASNKLPYKLEVYTDSNFLFADGSDMTRLIIRVTDKYGNPLPYATKIVEMEVNGPADLIGENPFPIIGGQAAVFIKSRHIAGQVTVHARTTDLPPSSAKIELISPIHY